MAKTRAPLIAIQDRSYARALLGLVLFLLLLTACGRERDRGASARSSKYRPEEGRLVEIEGRKAGSPAEPEAPAPAVQRGANQPSGNPEDQNTVERLRRDALRDLQAGNPDGAVAKLSRAVELAPGNAVAVSDLAAARLHRSVAHSDPYDLFRALAAANRALRLDPNLLAAAYNRALALQRISLDLRADEEWQRFQQRETDPFWKKAAEEHARSLTSTRRSPSRETILAEAQQAAERGDQRKVQEVVAGSPQICREHVERELLGAWAEAELENRTSESQKLLQTVRAIGAALAGNGEHMIADTVDQIDDLRRTAPQKFSRLAQGLQAYRQGYELVNQNDFAGARPVFEKAQRQLTEAGSPFAGWATYNMALCRYLQPDYGRARALLKPFFRAPYPTRYPALHARARWLEALMAMIEGDPVTGLAAFEAALADFRKLGEPSYAARMAGEVANILNYLGRRHEAWSRLHPALIEPAIRETPFSRYALFETAASLAQEEGENEIASWFQDEVVRSALATGSSVTVVSAFRRRAELRMTLGDNKAAAEDIAKARSAWREVPDADSRKMLEGDLQFAEARLAPSPEEALPRLDDAVRSFRDLAYHYQLAQALFERARAQEALGRDTEAEGDLDDAIKEFERQRARISNPEERISYFDRAGEMLDTMLQLQMEQRGRPDVAFGYSEQAKSRALLDWVVTHPFEGPIPENVQAAELAFPDPSSLQKDLPAATVVVEYAVLPRRLVIWVLRRDRFDTATFALEEGELEGRVRRLSQAVRQARMADFLKASSELHDILIRPIEKFLVPGDRIVVIPDGALHAVPFVALRNPRTRRYLVQDHICSVAPSTRLLIASLRRDEELASRRGPRALVVVDPDFDRELFPALPRLKASRTEASAQGFFPGSQVLSDREATPSAFLRDAGDYEILHFGGHSLVNKDVPLLSQMLFAAEPGDPSRGVLYSGDLLGQRFLRTRLAVLASCSTASGRISRTEGVQSLARPFLAAGVPTVVASLWNVEDQTTAELFGRFYSHLSKTFDPAAALRKAQIESLEQGSSEAAAPWAWGAFEVLGGNSPGR
jgi:CHAT domain-containing protein